MIILTISRVPAEIIFDQGIGDIFVVRVAVNVVNPEVIGSLEYATSVVGAQLLTIVTWVTKEAVQ